MYCLSIPREWALMIFGHNTTICFQEIMIENVVCKLSAILLRPSLCLYHDDVIKWKHFPRYWPFVWGIHQSPVNSPPKDQWRGALMFSFFDLGLNKHLSKQWWGWWFETPSHSLWRHCNVEAGLPECSRGQSPCIHTSVWEADALHLTTILALLGTPCTHTRLVDTLTY